MEDSWVIGVFRWGLMSALAVVPCVMGAQSAMTPPNSGVHAS